MRSMRHWRPLTPPPPLPQHTTQYNNNAQASVTDEGVVALVRSVGGTLQGLDLGLCASLSDASVLALAGTIIHSVVAR